MTNEQDPPDDAANLEGRVKRLEAQAQKRNQLLQLAAKRLPDPDRRQLLQAAAGMGAAGILGFSAGSAAATPGDDGDTVWGSDTNRDDYYADELDANLVNTDERSVENLAAELHQTTSQTLTGNTETKLAWDEADIDDAAVVDADITNDKIIINKSGVVLYALNVRLVEPPSNYVADLKVKVNGTLTLNSRYRLPGNSSDDISFPSVSATELVSAGDEIEFFVSSQDAEDEPTRASPDTTNVQVVHLG